MFGVNSLSLGDKLMVQNPQQVKENLHNALTYAPYLGFLQSARLLVILLQRLLFGLWVVASVKTPVTVLDLGLLTGILIDFNSVLFLHRSRENHNHTAVTKMCVTQELMLLVVNTKKSVL